MRTPVPAHPCVSSAGVPRWFGLHGRLAGGLRRSQRPRNDIGQYDDLVVEWERPNGKFAALHWLAASRRALVPQPSGPGELLVDVGCGGGLLADERSGPYVHVGIDLVESALRIACSRGLVPVRADVSMIPLNAGCASVVVAGEILEHVDDLDAVVGEICRVLRPGGTVVIDTISDTRRAKLALVAIAEHLPGGPPPRIHDPRLFVDPNRLTRLFRSNGVELVVWGLRPSAWDYMRFLLDRQRAVRMLPISSVALVYQGVGRKAVA